MEIPADQTCTSVPQQWHKPRSANIDPEPVMKCTFVKASSDQGGKRKLAPVTCKLYDARGKHLKLNGWKQEDVMEMCHYLSTEEKHSPFSYLLSDQECSSATHTVFGNVPLGSTLGYQLTDLKETKTTFAFYKPDSCVTLPQDQQPQGVLVFPKIPVSSACSQSFLPPSNFSHTTSEPIVQNISINIDRAWDIQINTVSQAQDPTWFEERKLRLTASNFGKVLHRKKEPTEPFLKSIFEAKDLSNVASIRHGKQNEKVVRSHYARKMQKHLNKNFTVYDTGLVVNPSHPYLGATPDGKVFDPTSASPFGLLEIKCPYTWRNHTVEAACNDVNFPCSMVDGVPKLRTDDKQGYYAQIQGQLALSGLPWCDFVIYLSGSRSLSVERISFDPTYWNNTLLPKLTTFYFKHCIPFLSKEKATSVNSCEVSLCHTHSVSH